MSDTSGISVCFGNVQDPRLLEDAKLALQDMKAKWSDRVQIDTTHFVCTSPAATPQGASATGGSSGAPGVEYQKALQASIPIVQPQWILGCHQARKMVPISHYALGTAPPAVQFTRPSIPKTNPTGTPRAAPSAAAESPRPKAGGSTSPFVNQPPSDSQDRPSASVTSTSLQSQSSSGSLQSADDGLDTPTSPGGTTSARTGKPARRRQGTMQKDFRFPSPVMGKPPTPPGEKDIPPLPGAENEAGSRTASAVVTAGSQIAPALPTPGESEKDSNKFTPVSPDGEEEVGETVEVDLN